MKIVTCLKCYLLSLNIGTRTKNLFQNKLIGLFFCKILFSTILLVANLLKFNSNNFIDSQFQQNNDFVS